MEETVNVEINKIDILNTEYFASLPLAEKQDIAYEISTGISHTVLISNDKFKMAAVIMIGDDSIHIRECDGNFIHMRAWLKQYCDMLGSFAGKKKITFCTKKRGIAALAKSEYKFEEYDGR